MSAIIMPLLMLNFVSESEKNTNLGLITFVGLILAIVVQPVAGAVSDHSGFGWGRRRPYILTGSLAAIILLMLLGLADGIIFILIIYCLLQVSSNFAHGPWQGFIPDLVPARKRGTASAVKGILETLGAVAGLGIAGYFLSQRFAGEANVKLFLTLGIIAAVIASSMIATVVLVKEKPFSRNTPFSLLQTMRNTLSIDSNLSSSFLFFLLSRFLFLMPLIILRTFGMYYLRDVAGLSDPVAAASDLMMAVGISLLVVIYPAGHFSDKFGRKLILIASGVLAAVGFVIMLCFHSYYAIILAGVFLGIANGCFMSTNWAMATELLAEGEEAKYLGLTNLATAGACAFAALAGPLIDLFNTFGNNFGYQVIFEMNILFLIVSSVLVIKIKKN